MALVASTTRSQGPASPGSVVALTFTVRSPEAPSTRKPFLRIASTCSRQRSIAHTSWPADANSPAYTEPIAPVPTIAIFMREKSGSEPDFRYLRFRSGKSGSDPDFSSHLKQSGGAHAAADAHRHHLQLCAAALAFDQRVPGQAGARHAVRVPEGDGPTVYVELVVRDADAVAAVDDLHREGLI